MKRILSLLVYGLLVFLMLTACTKSGTGETSAENQTVSGGTEKKEQTESVKKDPVKLTMMVQNHPAFPLKEEWLIWKLHEENANVDLKVSTYQGNWWEAIPLVVASGDMPDLMWMPSGSSITYGGQGALVDFLEHLNKMPNMKAFMDKYPEEVAPLLSVDGKMYMHPSHGSYGQYSSMYLYRKDIFDKHQLILPNTYEELYATMKKLKELYPESNPFYFPGLDEFGRLGLSLGIHYDFFYDPDSKTVKYGPSESNYKYLLDFVANAYKDRLIPMEFGNLNFQKLQEMLTNNKTFIYYGWESETGIDELTPVMRESNPEFTLAFMPPVAGPDGKRYNARQSLVGEGLTAATTSKNIEAALAYIDYLFTEKAKEAVSWGQEGVTFKVADGKKQYLPAVLSQANASINFGLRTSGNMAWVDEESLQALKSEQARAAYEEGLNYLAPMSQLPPLTKDENDNISLKRSAVKKYSAQEISKFVLGEKNLREWDAYIAELKKLGLDEILKKYNDAEARRQQQIANK